MIRIIRNGYTELHIECDEDLERIIKVLERLKCSVVGIVNYRKELAVHLYDKTNILVLTKQYLCRDNFHKIRHWQHYDIVSVNPWDRFVINKFIGMDIIDVIVLDFSNEKAIPSKDQVRSLVKRGKAIEILVNKVVEKGEHALRGMYRFLSDILHIDDLVLIFSQGISRIEDVRNPRDVYAFIQVLLEIDKSVLIEMRKRVIEFLTDVFYKRGLPYR